MKKLFSFITIFSIFLTLAACTPAPKLSPMQKRQMSTKIIKGNYQDVFKATMMVLQDQDYSIKKTDMDTGLIVALNSRDAGFGERMLYELDDNKNTHVTTYQTEVSATISKLNDKDIEVRFTIHEQALNNKGGISYSDQTYDAKTFNKLFYQLKIEVKRRQAIA